MISRNSEHRNIPVPSRPLIYCDVGARSGLGTPWNRYRDNLNVVSFEPDAEEYHRLKSNLRPGDTCLNAALFSEEATVPLHLTRSRGCSSIYKPNFQFLNQFPDSERFSIEKTLEMPATTLDRLYADGKLETLDFIKLDTQGSELPIMQGGRKLLKESIIGIEVEVEFSPMYEGQPLFADVDGWIRSQLGLHLQDLRCNYWKRLDGLDNGAIRGQVIFGDALYFRPVPDLVGWIQTLPVEVGSQKLEAALITAIAYGFPDYVQSLLAHPSAPRILSKTRFEMWQSFARKFARSVRFWRSNRNWGKPFQALGALFQAVHQGWASSDRPLGADKKIGWFA